MEKHLIKKAKSGDQQAFRQLYNLYADYGLRTAFTITNSKYDSGDIVQETFIKVYRNLHSFDVEKPFKPWFYRILINECNRFLKKKGKTKIASDEQIEFAMMQNHTEESKELGLLSIAIDNLEEHQRVPIILKYLDGFTEQEISEILELNVNTVKSRLFKGRNKLKELIKEEDR